MRSAGLRIWTVGDGSFDQLVTELVDVKLAWFKIIADPLQLRRQELIKPFLSRCHFRSSGEVLQLIGIGLIVIQEPRTLQ